MQIITIAGGLGRDAEVRRLQDGTPVASFSVGVGGRNEETTWWDVSMFGTRGEKLAPYLTKGSKVTVTGTFSTREHNGKTYLQCKAQEIALQGGGQQQERQQPAPQPRGLEDDVPF